jgi:type VII secretion integral membrane protein EccD
MTASELCRVTVQTHGEDRSVAADLSLPTGMELGEMLPSIVDLVGARSASATNTVTECWTMSRLDGSVLDESMTLQENGIRDGYVLLLASSDTQIPVAAIDDLCHTVIEASASDRDDETSPRMGAVACLWAAGFGATVLVCSGNTPVSNRAIIAAIVAVAATAGSIVAGRIAAAPLPFLALGMTAAAFAAVAGFLAVPGGPAPPNFLLAAVACAATSIVLLRAIPYGSTCFTALAALSTTAAIAAAVVVIWPAPVATVGAMLTAASLAMLGVAAKLSIAVAGLSPTMPGAEDRESDGETMPVGVRTLRAQRGHQTLTGLLTGFSASAAVGAVLVATGQRDSSALSGVGLTAVLSTVLLLRARQQLGVVRSTAIFTAGIVSTTISFTLVVISMPQHALWICLTSVILGVGGLWLTTASLATRLSPVARRGLELLEYVAIGSVVPLSCWVANVFGIVRGLSLP